MKTNKTWIAGLAAGLLTGGGVALVATLPGGAGASPTVIEQTDDTTATADSTDSAVDHDRGQWVADALAPLVEDGTITQAQADAVIAALEDAKPDFGGRGPGGPMVGEALDAVAEELGLTADEIRTALQDGQSLADLAAANGSSAQAVVDILVAEAQTHLDEHVADGDITQEEADTRLADVTERITAMVNGEMPAFDGHGPGMGGPGGPGGRGGHGHMGDMDGDASTDQGTDAGS